MAIMYFFQYHDHIKQNSFPLLWRKAWSSATVFAIEPIVLVDRNICFSPHTIHESDLVHARFIAFKGDRLLDINENKNETTDSSLGVVTSLIYTVRSFNLVRVYCDPLGTRG